MKLKRIKVKGLFHTFNHEINFAKGSIIIIIGENGIGKTTILQIIRSIFSKKFDFLFSIDFDSIELEFSRGKWIISKDDDGLVKIYSSLEDNSFIVRPIQSKDSFFHRFLVPLDEGVWLDRRIGARLNRKDVIERYGFDPLLEAEDIPNWFDEIIKENRVIFIQTQRLYRIEYERERDSRELEHMVNTYSNDLVKILQQNNAIFTATSIQLDSTFPMRLLKVLKGPRNNNYLDTTIEDINNLNDYRSLLSSVGIIDKQKDEFISNSLQTLNNPSALSILNLYISDNRRKLNVFSDTAKKLEILLSIINKRFKHKKLYIDKKEGFVIKSNYENRTIDVSKLSSGEQNELIIFYNLLFKTNDNDIVLIDEPEISLHIAWQQQLINDLTEIVKETGISLLISTHSPDIIGDNWSMVQTLSGRE